MALIPVSGHSWPRQKTHGEDPDTEQGDWRSAGAGLQGPTWAGFADAGLSLTEGKAGDEVVGVCEMCRPEGCHSRSGSRSPGCNVAQDRVGEV